MPLVGQQHFHHLYKDSARMTMLETSTSPSSSSPSKRNKRKSQEPKRLSLDQDSIIKRPRLETSDGEDHHTTPSPRNPSSLSPGSSECRSPSPTLERLAPKKRFKQEALKDLLEEEKKKSNNSPFRPWDKDVDKPRSIGVPMTPNAWPSLLHADDKTRLMLSLLQDPRLLKQYSNQPGSTLLPALGASASLMVKTEQEPEQEEPLALVVKREPVVKQHHNEIVLSEQIKIKHEESDADDNDDNNDSIANEAFDWQYKQNQSSTKSKQRNYKNMTRERRVEANARERQRVHTITAAFDTLQNAIPVEDKCSKMSKLSIIKIATSYIMCLSRQCDYDYSSDKSQPSLEECREQLNELIQAEAKLTSTCLQEGSSSSSKMSPSMSLATAKAKQD
jgi:hypothetical protein